MKPIHWLFFLGVLLAGLLASLDRVPGAAPVLHALGGVGAPTVSAPSVQQVEPLPTPVAQKELRPRVLEGEPIVVELIEEPAKRYSGDEPTEADKLYGPLVAGLGRADVVYDANLGHAARELAYQQSVVGTVVPSDVLDFLLHSGGAVDKTVLQAFAQTSEDAGDPLQPVRKRILELVGEGEGVHRVGIGEAILPGARLGRTIAVLVSNRGILLNPAPRFAQRHTRWVLSGTLPPTYQGPEALVLRPSGVMDEIPVTVDASDPRRFTLVVPTGDEKGELIVSLIATGPHGPGPLVQVPVAIDVPLPRRFETTMPGAEVLPTNDAAEDLAFRLLNDDRARFGLPALARDGRLDAIAREHSRDMRDNGWFGHWSDLTGAPGDRLAAASYRAASYAENVASARSIHGAQAGLLDSLGHRRNILSPALDRVGIGVVGKREGGQVQWYLTQLFAKAAEDIDVGKTEAVILGRIDAARTRAGRAALVRDGRLDRLCAEAAKTAAAGGNDDMATVLMGDAKQAGETRGGAFAWVQVVATIEDARLPEQAEGADFTRAGIAVVQLADHPSGIIGVALLVAGPRH